MRRCLYKIWPVTPIAPGNYAVIVYTQGEGDVRVWDFTYRVGESSVAAAELTSKEAGAKGGERP